MKAKRMMKLNIIIVGIILTIIPMSLYAQSIKPENVKVIILSPSDGKAVVTIDNTEKMQIFKIGDQIGDLGKLIHVSESRLVIEKLNETGKERIIISLVDGKQKIMRTGMNGKKPVRAVPQEIVTSSEGNQTKDGQKPLSSIQ